MKKNTNEPQKGSAKKIITALVLLVASIALSGPVSGALTGLLGENGIIAWDMPFRLVAMLSGMVLLAEVLRSLLSRWVPKTNHGRTASTLIRSALRYILGLVGLMWALAIVGVDVQSLLAGAGIVALIIGFGAESLIADVITGVFLIFEHQYEVGDIIELGTFRGTVTQIGIRTTCITDSGGNVQIINNSDIRNLINRSSDNSFAVCDIAIPYRGYLAKAEEVLAAVLPTMPAKHPDYFEEAPTYLGVQQLDIVNDAVVLRISAEVDEKNIYSGQRVLNRELLIAFEEAGISNPVAEVKLTRE